VNDFDAGVSRLRFQFREPSKHSIYNGAYSVAMPPPYFGLSRHKADYDRNRTLSPTFAIVSSFRKNVFGKLFGLVWWMGQALC